MSDGTYTNQIEVKINGRALTPRQQQCLVEAWVDASVNLPAAFQLTFRDQQRTLLSDLGAKIGAKVELRAKAIGKDGGGPLFTGEVTAMEADFDDTGKFSVVRGHDPGHRLLRNRRVEGYQNMTASDIARKLASRNGLKIGKISSTRTPYKMITQPNVTDWDFLTRLAQENDVELYFSDTGRFQFVDPKPASGAPGKGAKAKTNPRVLEFGINLLRCRTVVTASDQVKTVQVRGWDAERKRAVTAKKPATSNPELAIGLKGQQASSPFGAAELVETDIPYDTNAQVKEAAAALADDVSAAFAELEAEVRGDPKLRPGMPVALTGIGKPFEGKYTVTAARHVFTVGRPYETRLTVSGRQHRSLFGLASGGSAPASSALPGVASAIVTDIDRRGRVKLKFPWLDDTYVSDWARVAQFGGVRGGGLLTPEVNDEVLVAFDRGALDHPYVIGGLYNGVDRLPRYQKLPVAGMNGRVNWRSIADRTGNRVELVTGMSSRGVKVSTGDDRVTIELRQIGHRLTVNSDGSVEISGTRLVTVKGAMVRVNATQRLDLQAPSIGMRAPNLNITGMVSVQGKLDVTGLITQNQMPVMIVPA